MFTTSEYERNLKQKQKDEIIKNITEKCDYDETKNICRVNKIKTPVTDFEKIIKAQNPR